MVKITKDQTIVIKKPIPTAIYIGNWNPKIITQTTVHDTGFGAIA